MLNHVAMESTNEGRRRHCGRRLQSPNNRLASTTWIAQLIDEMVIKIFHPGDRSTLLLFRFIVFPVVVVVAHSHFIDDSPPNKTLYRVASGDQNPRVTFLDIKSMIFAQTVIWSPQGMHGLFRG